MFEKGDKVNTPVGPGVIVYKRMLAPDYINVAAYSVKLDNKDGSGSIFPAELVTRALDKTSH